MKIIKDGIAKNPKSELETWWTTNQFRCPNCQCIFQLESKDLSFLNLTRTEYYSISDKVNLTCPFCNLKCSVVKPILLKDNILPIFDDVFGKTGLFDKLFGSNNYCNKL